MKRIRILIADDHLIVRIGLRALLETERDFEIVGEARNGNEAVSETLRLRPDIVIMDLMMPKKDGVQATEELCREVPGTGILLLTTFATSDGLSRALAAGARGAIFKSATDTQLLAALREIASGGSSVSPEINRLIAADPPAKALTERQLGILDLARRGYSNPDIARLLKISETTVKNHFTVIFEKLGVATRTEAVGAALRKHLLTV